MQNKSFRELVSYFKLTVPPDYTSEIRRIYDEPTYLGFKLLFHFNDSMSPLLNLSDANNDKGFSAYNYLVSNGYNNQAFYLKNFINQLQYISQNSEWYFQGIDGLDNIWNFDFNEEKIKQNKELNITTLEGLDMRVTKLLDYYYRACYDQTNRREILPVNLRYFTMSIYITDIREFDKYNYDVEDVVGDRKPVDMENSDNRASLFFRLELCEFMKLSRANILGSVSNTQFDQAINKIGIKMHGNVIEYNNYILATELQSELPLNGELVPTNKPQSFMESKDQLIKENRLKFDAKEDAITKIKNAIASGTTNLVDHFVRNSIDDIKNDIKGAVMPLLLGNVYNNNILNAHTIREALDGNLSLNNFVK